MKVLKTVATLFATGALLATAATGAFAQDKGLIGIAMPTSSSLRWISDGNELKSALEGMGYTVDLQYAEDEIPNQLAQVENMVTKGAKALVIGSIDGTTLSAVLQQAADQGVKVIAYDRLIRDSGNVDYYTTFDNFQVGVLQANSLVKGLNERFADQKPWNVELFGGSPDDNNAFFFYDGAMAVLQPMIDSGDIVIKSGQMGMEQVGTLRWDGAVAQARMDNILSANYSDGTRVHGVLAPYDGLSRGIISSLRGVGYGSGDLAWPIITGQDAEVPSVKAIIAGEQYSTVFKDTRELAQYTAQLLDTVLSGNEPSGLDTTTYDNGVKVVPSILLTPYEVDATNYKERVIDSGYIKAEELQ
ncbi:MULTISPECIES: multiple monosaccharide ABC transporter substrate-binding protein [Devosia]|uniref:Multiple sugar-binding periplasmic receptor ChvE n=1 Tax=Devosia equisanguinis TaxID=2490941 RepID=A0A3S4CEL3_9HYPH|nr:MULTISPECIES: multiple monosaccharide ABC transporter substrate-binding protein [Devosia]ODT50792.1 MAG: sugar ABC transporter substrate-binding protein [Pelagibacterium sp. SCN 63-126]ODU81677.1 MAG: sugar ABC transporter substrate-binding protein [Pelagibacterium sp. SCN 63-17]OJX44546.1 MAG: sugar ABC transporter substrate-binding protein [Devosia sp. 63-57]VDS05463.1 Multiple sugar-binding periplasmic receptor ChvE precursor [Devosia equisanguinis]